MPRPTPASACGSAAAAALVVGELAKANPAPTPSMPAETTMGEAPAAKVERKRAASNITARPAKMGGLMPIRSERRPANGERTARAMAPGVNAKAAALLGSSLTVEIRSGMMTRQETLASIEKNPTTTAATKPVFRKRFGETNGWGALVMRRV